MLPNPEKSEVMLVGTCVQQSAFSRPLFVDIAGSCVEAKDSIVSLGVSVDSGLTCQRRIGDIVSSCNYHLRALKHIRPALNSSTAQAVGRAIVLSRLDYCNALLAGTNETGITRLQRVQNRLVRMTVQLPFRAHVGDARIALHWLPIRERIVFKLAVLAFEVRRTREPSYLAELLISRVPARMLRSSSDASQLVNPRTRNKRYTRAFSSAAPTVWNALPSYLRECGSLKTFKTRLKSFLFN